MAFLSIKNVAIAGISAGVPKQVMPTISTTDKYDADAFAETTGVIEKRYDNDFTTSDLGEKAAEQLIADLNWDRKEIGALIFVSQTPDYVLPATACILQDKLGLSKDCFALDISLGCSGWVYGLSVISSLMQTGMIKKGILIAGDARKQCIEEADQLFGFAATATAIEYRDGAEGFQFHFGTDGSGYDAIIKPVGGCRNQVTSKDLIPVMCEDGRERHGFQTRMKGMDVFAFGITTAPKSIKKLVAEYSIDTNNVEYYVFHQANKKMNETIRKKLKLTEEQVPYSMTHFGNTSSASIPLTIVTQIADKIKGKRTEIIGCGFGVGLSWGTVHFTTDSPVISNLVEL
jgi:3-oxoacyl-[acyl-carrier-protein] synthase-3